MPPRQRKFVSPPQGYRKRPPRARKPAGSVSASAIDPSTSSGPAAQAGAPPAPRHRPTLPRTPRAEAGPPPEQEGDSWDQVATWYDSLASDQGTEFHQKVITPGVLRLLALQQGERALDLACGQGAVTRALHRAGAQVTGVDLSRRLIDLARQRSPLTVRLLVGDVRRLEQLEDGSFDAAVCVLAAQNLDPLAPMLAEAARLLRSPDAGLRPSGEEVRPGGRLVLVLNHPAFRIPRQSGWRWDEARKLMYREEARYLTPLKIPIDLQPFKAPGQRQTWTYHRPLQDYVNGLAAAGLWTNALEEWPSHKVSQPGVKSRGENRARAEFPLFLALRAVKAG